METNFVYGLLGDNIFAWLAIVSLPLGFLLVYALVAILGELKISAFIQQRLGPMRTGWKGVIQPLAEVVKLIQKEDITPDPANKLLFNMAPYLMFAAAFACFAVIPFAPQFVPTGINLGLFYIFAIGSLGVIGLVMGGWASNNKYSLLGAMRSVAQIISYEIPVVIAILTIAVMANSLDLNVIIAKQEGWFWNWNVFGGPGPVAKILVMPFTFGIFIIYLIGTLAETNRTPFDIPEGESEIVAGYHTEYSGMKFAMFFFAEYANMFVVSALLSILFFGGWNPPYGDLLLPGWLGQIEAVTWFVLKAFFFVFLQIWLRWTLPRLRVDQLMVVAWKYLLPFAFLCFFAISFWEMLK